jgi:hypothetical protein
MLRFIQQLVMNFSVELGLSKKWATFHVWLSFANSIAVCALRSYAVVAIQFNRGTAIRLIDIESFQSHQTPDKQVQLTVQLNVAITSSTARSQNNTNGSFQPVDSTSCVRNPRYYPGQSPI